MGLANGDCGISCDLLVSYSLPPHLNWYFYSRIVSKIVISFVAFEPPHITSHHTKQFDFISPIVGFDVFGCDLFAVGIFVNISFQLIVMFPSTTGFVSFRFVFVNDCIDELMMHITA